MLNYTNLITITQLTWAVSWLWKKKFSLSPPPSPFIISTSTKKVCIICILLFSIQIQMPTRKWNWPFYYGNFGRFSSEVFVHLLFSSFFFALSFQRFFWLRCYEIRNGQIGRKYFAVINEMIATASSDSRHREIDEMNGLRYHNVFRVKSRYKIAWNRCFIYVNMTFQPIKNYILTNQLMKSYY